MEQQNEQLSFEELSKRYVRMLQLGVEVAKESINALPKSNDNQESENMTYDPFNISGSFMQAMQEVWADPKKAVDMNIDLANNYVKVWQNVTNRFFGENVEPLFGGDKKDRRFSGEDWESNPMFDFIRQSYHLNADWTMNIVNHLKSLPPKDAQKVIFYTKLLLDAMSPTNFAATNPEVIKETIATQGVNLLKGAENLYADLAKSKGKFKITTATEGAFALGENLAMTPGSVVYQNDLMQLIQYTPTTQKVHETPLIVMPAWINKYYILDLQQKNSFVKWLVDQGHTVFMISWINPDSSHKDNGFFEYMKEGPLAAMEQVQKITSSKSVNFMGYCLGGTLLACAVAYLKAKAPKNFPINSATFLTALVDFEEAGDLSVFIDEEQIQALEGRMSQQGYLDGSDMAQTFSMIRANDMIWSFYVNNYLMGKDPFPFDILYWNSDSTRLPAKMHSFYLRSMYHKNLLRKPGGIKLGGTPIDISKNDLPTYMLATRQDHIVPWESAYRATQIYTGPIRFALSGSGHVAGVVNHPDSKKYNYWTNDKLPQDPQKWLDSAQDNPGSWWVDWDKWSSKLSGPQVPARQIDKKHVIEAAPGSYVKVKI